MAKLTLTRRRVAIGGACVVALALFIASRSVCLSAWLSYGISLNRCPDGKVRQTAAVESRGLRRGKTGLLDISAMAHYAVGLTEEQAAIEKFEASAWLVGPGGKESALVPEFGWSKQEGHRQGNVELPEVPDGDYLLRAKIHSRVGDAFVDAPLPLYTPARVHVITDRPLYKPGDTVKFRAVVVKATDFSPLDGRPGYWFLENPSGEVVLEEKSPAGEWGVVAGNFPLDRGAPEGEWKVRWSSAGASDEVRFRVQPFTLPRFKLEVSAARPSYRSGERPRIEGNVIYSSGAPVPTAVLTLDWTSGGAWPPPTAWMEGGLPRSVKGDASGHFALELPVVPADIRGQATLSAQIGAVDPAGDRVEGEVSVLLSEDPIQASAVTELGESLVGGFNNRLYLRASTASGEVLPGAQLTLKRAWDAKDKGLEATADEDGVAAFQIDPGPAVNVVIPPMPVRPPAKRKEVTRLSASDHVSGREPPLSDQLAMDAWTKKLAPCVHWAESTQSVNVAMTVDPSGSIRAMGWSATPLGACVGKTLRGERLPAGKTRLYELAFQVDSEDVPKLDVSVNGVSGSPNGLEQALTRAALDARACIPKDADTSYFPELLSWSVRASAKKVETAWLPDPEASLPRTSEAVVRCVQGKLERLALDVKPREAEASDDDEEAASRSVGFARFEVIPSPRMQQERPQATVQQGYQLVVSARNEKGEVGSTKLFLRPGALPPLRLRASSVLADPGQTVTVELLRGPGFAERLPEELAMTGGKDALVAKVDPAKHKAAFALPADASGWREVSWSGARALVFVKPRDRLSVEVKPDKARYAPGQTATLGVLTAISGKGTQAAVGLFGVDQSLAQLAPLPGPDDLSRIRPKVETSEPAFGSLDGQALTMGRIRGANAAAATVLRVGALPGACESENPVALNANGQFDSNADLTDHFYAVLEELHALARDWEEKAPQGEQMHPPRMAELWQRALDAAAKKGTPVEDVYGRRLRLSMLPADLLALVDPREVVIEGTRLPEDVESWSGWVEKEKP